MRGRRGWTWIAGASLALAGCSDKKGEAEKPVTTAAATTPPPSATPLPAGATSAGAAPAAGGLALVAHGSGMRLYALGSMAAVVSGKELFVIDERGLRQDLAWQAGFSGIPEAQANEKNGYDVMGVAPDAVWIQAWVQGGGTMDPPQEIQTFRWAGKVWGAVQPLDRGETLVGVVPIGKGRTAGLVLGDKGALRWIPGNTRSAAVPSAPTLPDEAEDAGAPAAPGSATAGPASVSASAPASASASAAAPASASAAPPASASTAPALASASASAAPPASASAAPPTSASAAPARPESGPARVRVEPAFWTWMDEDDRGLYFPAAPVSGTAAGQIVLVGFDAAKTGRRSLLGERWAPGGGKSVVAELPEPAADEGGRFGALAVGAGDAWIYGTGKRPYLAHLVGAAWAREEPPVPGRIASMTAADDGTVYMVVADTLFRRGSGEGAWQNVAVPAHATALAAAAVVGGKLWVASSTELFGPEAPRVPVHLPSSGDTTAARADLLRYPLTEICPTPFVVLKSKVSPASKTFPEVEDLVKRTLPIEGVELLTEISSKWTYLGARVPTVEAAVKLRDAMNAADPKALAVVYCHVPRAVKKIPLSP